MVGLQPGSYVFYYISKANSLLSFFRHQGTKAPSCTNLFYHLVILSVMVSQPARHISGGEPIFKVNNPTKAGLYIELQLILKSE